MATQNIERRVEVLEAALRVGEKQQTVDEMFDAMERGDYGQENSLMGIVAGAMNSSKNSEPPGAFPEAFLESLRKDLPVMLVDWFVDQFVDWFKNRNAETGDGGKTSP